MFLPCPHCGFLVALIASNDGSAQRCPRCDGLVVAAPADQTDTASTVALEDPDASEETGADLPETPIDGELTAQEQAPDPEPQTAPEAAPPVAAHAAVPAKKTSRRARHAPSFARQTTPIAITGRRWPWWSATITLALLLALQLLLAQRHDLAASARWRPLITGLCGVLQCDVPPWREPAAYTMLGRNVQPKSGMPGVLTASASFRNDARWPQPWPTLLLSLSDVDGNPVGLRGFSPREYHGDAIADETLAPGQSATVQFDVVEPAPRIVAFTFDFQ